MRSMMITTLFAVTSLAVTPPSTAEACGGYDMGPRAPQVFAVERHHDAGGEGIAARTRYFAVFSDAGASEDKTAPWRVLAPNSYDRTKMAPAPDLSAELTLTLVGPKGTRVVSSKRQVLIADTFEHRTPMRAIEFEAPSDQHWTMAVVGAKADVVWKQHKRTSLTREARVLVRDRDLTTTYGGAGIVAGRTVVSVLSQKNQPATFVASGSAAGQTLTGDPIGGLELDGVTYLLVSFRGRITAVAV